jgi:hypothetical protein
MEPLPIGKNDLLHYGCPEQTRDGRSIVIRAIRPADKKRAFLMNRIGLVRLSG